MHRIPLFLLLLAPMLALAGPSTHQWYSVLLDGRKIGRFESSRVVEEGIVTTRQKLDIEFDRAGTPIAMGSSESSVETRDGKPLAFTSVANLSGNETRIEGRLNGNQVNLSIGNGGATEQRAMAWPRGALLAEGLRLAGLHAPLTAGSQHRELSFQPSSLDAIEVTTTIGARERIDLPDGPKSLVRIEQVFNFAGSPVLNTAWIDDERDVYKLTMPAIGVELTLLACDKACAYAPNQRSDVFERTLMPSPRALESSELSTALRYTISPRNHDAPMNMPETSEQSVTRSGEDLVVEIHRDARTGFGGSAQAADKMPNDWLQSAAPDLVSLAVKATRGIDGDLERMQALEDFVRGFISNKTLGVGYASALQVVHKPEGDCTEHAVLLAAMGRSLGIATRVVDGLVYTPRFASIEHVFVPHAWMQAWVEGRWQSFDAALGGFDAGHIAFSTGDGDPWRFYQGLDLLGRTRLKHVEPIGQSTRQ